MKKMWSALLYALAASAMLGVPAHADAQDFTVKSFTADYYLSRGADKVANLRVSEKIAAQFPDFDQNHGILRAIPQSYQGHPLELQVQGVHDDHANNLHYTTYRSNGNLVLKIGDANKYVHGEQWYVIDYTMRGVSSAAGDHQEFYWDVNGDQWQQQFDTVLARVHVPQDIFNSMQSQQTCYVGAAGSQDTNDCGIGYSSDTDGNHVVTFISSPLHPLQPAQTMSVVLRFANGTFASYSPSAWQIWQWVWMGLGIALPPLLALAFVLRRWLRFGRDPKGRGVIVPQYSPPKEVSVLGSAAVLWEGFRSTAISATIVDLAVRHYIKIYEVAAGASVFKKNDYQLELIKEPSGLRPEEKSVVEMVFPGGAEVGQQVMLSSLKQKLSTQSQRIGKSVDMLVTEAGYFRTTPEKAKLPYYIWGGVLSAAGFGFVALVASWGLALGFAIGLFAAGAVMFIGGSVMPARTAKGVALREYLLGVRDYMKLAEAERIKVLQSPHGVLTEKIDAGDNKQLIKLYEKLLPYAMLFKIEQDWAKEMAPLYKQAPDWYVGSSTFNAVWFASSIGGFSQTSNAAFAPPSSSGSGGGAGGGGGGGGGGGW